MCVWSPFFLFQHSQYLISVLTVDIPPVIQVCCSRPCILILPTRPVTEGQGQRRISVEAVIVVLATTIIVDVVKAVDVTVGVGANWVVFFFAVCVIVIGMKVSTSW